jgi:uncharacterized protein DUF3485
MNRSTLLPKLSWFSLIAGGLLSLITSTGWFNPAVTPDLQKFPAQMGPFLRNYEIEVDPLILGDLPPERYSFQSIAGPDGQEGRLYIAYYARSRRWSGRPHDVNVCFRSQGFEEFQTETLLTTRGAVLWSRVFRKPEREVRVVHWQQRPGTLPSPREPFDTLRRLLTPQGLRQDVASIYLEFDLDTAPQDKDLAAASQAIIDQIEQLWQT